MLGTIKKGLSSILALIVLSGAVFISHSPIAFAAGFSFAGGDGTAESPYQIASAEQLDFVRENMDAGVYYELVADIDLTDFLADIGGEGWEPIGTESEPFFGIVDGKQHTIKGLTIDRSSASNQALFGYTGIGSEIKNVHLLEVNVYGAHAVGSLVGRNDGGLITNASAAGHVQGMFFVGGLVGCSKGAIDLSYTDVTVSGWIQIGGLAGCMGEAPAPTLTQTASTPDVSSITHSYALGNVIGIGGGMNSSTGGLVGFNNGGSITGSYAAGDVSGGGSSTGGLAGTNIGGTISNSYATGEITGSDKVGGLVGHNYGASIITDSYASGNVSSIADNVGGLVGQNEDSSITYSHALGAVASNDDNIGGLVGYSLTGSIESSYAAGDVRGSQSAGGLVGYSESSSVTDSHATGEVTGNQQVGGLIGLRMYDNLIHNSYAAGDVTGNSSVGGLVGGNYNTTAIEHSYAIGDVTNSGDNTGGLVGYSQGGFVADSYAGGAVAGIDYVGGLVGNGSGFILKTSYATGTVIGNNLVGGLVGYNLEVSIENSYARGNVSGHDRVGGLVGLMEGYMQRNSITNSYAAGHVISTGNYAGGLVGDQSDLETIHAYYDMDTTEQSDEGKGEGKSSIEMKIAGTYGDGTVSWDFDDIWGIDSVHNDGYPYLRAIQLPVTYDGNGNTGGTVPIDNKFYWPGEMADIAGNTGDLTKTGFAFGGWSAASNGEGDYYAPGSNQITEETHLYARWVAMTSDLASSSKTSTTVSFSWTPAIGVLNTRIEKSPAGANTWTTATTGTIDEDATTATVTDLIAATNYDFRLAVVGEGYSGYSNTVTVMTDAVPQPSDGSSNISLPPDSDKPGSNVNVLINGKAESLGTKTTTTVDGRTIATVKPDPAKLIEKLASEKPGATVTIPVESQSDVLIGELDGQTVKNMEDEQAVLEIRSARAAYKIPALQIDIGSISEQMGDSVNLADITIQIEIAEPTSEAVDRVKRAAEKDSFLLVVPPLNFTIRATYKGKTVEVTSFNAYVERRIAIPDDVDPGKITTGVVVEPDGTVRHVPTKIVKLDGQYFAIINSLTNSTYAVIWNPIAYNDMDHHWAMAAVHDMASRLIIAGVGSGLFNPDEDITRAEFAAIVTRGLGLKTESEMSVFSDVKATSWYSDAIHSAYQYGLIDGFADGTFRPEQKITREQAMVMIAKAMAITNLKAEHLSDGQTLRGFNDAAETSNWAKNGIEQCLRAGIITGRNDSRLAPKAFITRAEAAVVVKRLLQKSELI